MFQTFVLYKGRGRRSITSEKKNEIDTRIKPHKRPRRDYWPRDLDCREYFSSVIPKVWQYDACWENKITWASKRLLDESTTLLQEQYHEVSPVISQTKEDYYRAKDDARADMRDFDKQAKLDRRDAATEAGTCDPDYEGTCKDDCRGKGVRGACNSCSGQVVKAGGTEYTKRKSRRADSGGARSSRIKSNHVYDGPLE